MVAELTLAGSYRETAYQVKSLLRASKQKVFVFENFYRRCAAIRGSSRVRTVLVRVKPSFATATVAALEEIRAQLRALADAGKELIFYASDYRDQHLYLASACATRLIHPLGSLRCTGLARTNLFFKRLADRYNVSVQVVRRGKYKSAMDRFRLDTIDPANLEQYQRWLDVSAARLHETILDGYGRDRADLDHLLAGNLLDPGAALERGWVDRIVPLDTLRAEWRRDKLRTRKVKTPRHVGKGKGIAVLYFEGSIMEGENRYDPLLGQSIGADSFVAHVEALRKNRRIKGVVLRVNSGGGSAVASETIRSALSRLAEEKPLVVSMAEVAGSGGYWIAMLGVPVFASMTTLTGSIGVINLAADLGETLSRRGVTHSTIRTHDHSDAGGLFRPLTTDELAQIEAQVGSVYARFVNLVADTRKLTLEQVEESAQGRVWAGVDAHAQQLVDRVGGLGDAIEEVTSLAGLRRARTVFFPRIKHSLLERMLYSRGSRALVDGRIAGPESALVRYAGVLRSRLANRPLLLEPALLLSGRSLDGRLADLLDADLEVE